MEHDEIPGGRRARDLPTRYLDNPALHDGYGLYAMNSSQAAVLWRRVVADTRGEYNASVFSKRWARWVIAAGVAGNFGLFILEGVRIATGH